MHESQFSWSSINIFTVSNSGCIQWSSALNRLKLILMLILFFPIAALMTLSDEQMPEMHSEPDWTEQQMLCSSLLLHFLPLLHHLPFWSLNTRWRKPPSLRPTRSKHDDSIRRRCKRRVGSIAGSALRVGDRLRPKSRFNSAVQAKKDILVFFTDCSQSHQLTD